jgi:hypothetical protein
LHCSLAHCRIVHTDANLIIADGFDERFPERGHAYG